jgi:hypothetical protein
VGRLSDGKTLGFWMVVFAQPYRGRAIPFHFGIYSERTLNEEAASRNLRWRELMWEVKDVVGETPLVFDRELLGPGVAEGAGGSGVKFVDEEGEEEIPLVVEKGEKRNVEGAYYRGETKANVAGVWREGCREPLVMGNLPSDELVDVYEERMKIKQTFKDSKSLLDVQKVMSKKRAQLEIALALVLLAYGLGLMMGEAVRDEACEAAEKAGKKGVSIGRGEAQMGALLGALRAAQGAAEVHGEAIASRLGSRTSAMGAALAPASA